MDRGAIFDESAAYRYSLFRRWGDGCSRSVFVMLNPSTADAFKEDPTITRCIRFAQAWGHDELEIVNLFALRSTDPAKLLEADDPVGPRNDYYIGRACQSASRIVCAWGAHKAVRGRDAEAWRSSIVGASNYLAGIFCLGTTQCGHPKHPLYLKSATQLEGFRPTFTDGHI